MMKNAKQNVLLKGEGNGGGQVPISSPVKSAIDIVPRTKEEVLADHHRMMEQLELIKAQNN
jgi:hypothetical protein